eukprot:UN25148
MTSVAKTVKTQVLCLCKEEKVVENSKRVHKSVGGELITDPAKIVKGVSLYIVSHGNSIGRILCDKSIKKSGELTPKDVCDMFIIKTV